MGRGGDGEGLVSITEVIIQCIINVHKALGPGFLENVYQRALVIELRSANLIVEVEKEVLIFYRGQEVGRQAQVRSYLKATGLSIALLVNFSKEKPDFRRVDASDKSLSISPAGVPAHYPSLP